VASSNHLVCIKQIDCPLKQRGQPACPITAQSRGPAFFRPFIWAPYLTDEADITPKNLPDCMQETVFCTDYACGLRDVYMKVRRPAALMAMASRLRVHAGRSHRRLRPSAVYHVKGRRGAGNRTTSKSPPNRSCPGNCVNQNGPAQRLGPRLPRNITAIGNAGFTHHNRACVKISIRQQRQMKHRPAATVRSCDHIVISAFNALKLLRC